MTPAPDPLSPALVLTMGEPAGVGPDVTLRAWLDRASTQIPAFFCLADPDVLRSRAAAMGLKVAIERVSPGDAADCFPRALPVVPLEARAKAEPGKIEQGNGRAVIESIARGVGYVREGSASAIVTNPINKRALYDAGFQHPGHTEFLGALAGTWGIGQARPVTMLVGPDLRTVPVTIHIALSEVARTLTAPLIVETARTVVADLRRRFAIENPRVAVAALNPHAGEGGAMGREDNEIVSPAVEALRAEGVAARGPLPADTMFHPAARATYDVALCMYHDQALIPVKALAFAEAVNLTLGLPFVRSSPDHGTGLDIAGTGKADATSLAAALRLAAQLAANEAVA
jgi:4-hydroxythreonine-4-phosphate dehydrogenase